VSRCVAIVFGSAMSAHARHKARKLVPKYDWCMWILNRYTFIIGVGASVKEMASGYHKETVSATQWEMVSGCHWG